MIQKTVLLILLVFSFSAYVDGQSKKEKKELGLKSKTVINVDYENSNGKEVRESFEKYDEKSNLIEEIEYDKAGKITKHVLYEYNSDNDKTKETHYSASNKIIKVEKYIYEGKLKKEKHVFDNAGKMLSKKKYLYEVY